MTTNDQPRAAEDAVRIFGRALGRRTSKAPHAIQALVDGRGGVAQLCAVEAAIVDRWASEAAKELVWLTRSAEGDLATLRLRALDAVGAVLHEAAFLLTPRPEASPLREPAEAGRVQQ